MLKEKLDLLLDRIEERDTKQRDFGLAEINKEVQGATTSVTSVPKPLKFLSRHYPRMKEMYEKISDPQFKVCTLTRSLEFKLNQDFAFSLNLRSSSRSSAWSRAKMRSQML
jgi:hypothetical protein